MCLNKSFLALYFLPTPPPPFSQNFTILTAMLLETCFLLCVSCCCRWLQHFFPALLKQTTTITTHRTGSKHTHTHIYRAQNPTSVTKLQCSTRGACYSLSLTPKEFCDKILLIVAYFRPPCTQIKHGNFLVLGRFSNWVLTTDELYLVRLTSVVRTALTVSPLLLLQKCCCHHCVVVVVAMLP